MTNDTVTARPFWLDLWSRLWRQSLQVLLVVLAAAQAGTLDRVTLQGLLFITVLRAFATLRVSDDAVWWAQILDRAVAAAAGAALGVAGADAWTVLNADWVGILQVAGAAAATAVIHGFLDPPTPAADLTVGSAGDEGAVLTSMLVGTLVLLGMLGMGVTAVAANAPALAHAGAATAAAGADTFVWDPVNKSWVRIAT